MIQMSSRHQLTTLSSKKEIIALRYQVPRKTLDKISEGERNAALEMCNDTISWLDKNQTAEAQEYKEKQNQLENAFKPVIQKIYGTSQSGPNFSGSTGCGAESGQGFGGSNYGGPTVEEVD